MAVATSGLNPAARHLTHPPIPSLQPFPYHRRIHASIMSAMQPIGHAKEDHESSSLRVGGLGRQPFQEGGQEDYYPNTLSRSYSAPPAALYVFLVPPHLRLELYDRRRNGDRPRRRRTGGGHRMDDSPSRVGSVLEWVWGRGRPIRKVRVHVGDDLVMGGWHLQTQATGGGGSGSDRTNRYRRVSTEWWPRLGSKTSGPHDPQLLHDQRLASSVRRSSSHHLSSLCFRGHQTDQTHRCGDRQIIMYPPDGCDYIALSYVWGGVEQPSYKLGEILPTVPATFEDAMVVTRHIGKQYLWAYSLCIDQENSVEKAVQIAPMSTIYSASGAWATIISLSGRSARSGLPRVGTLPGVVAQLSCEIGGQRLLSVMPTLSQQISWSPWVSRAWTFQEGLPSPRCLFFTNHQVYFECNSVQCCESLDDSNSPFHLSPDEQRRVALNAMVRHPTRYYTVGPKGTIG